MTVTQSGDLQKLYTRNCQTTAELTFDIRTRIASRSLPTVGTACQKLGSINTFGNGPIMAWLGHTLLLYGKRTTSCWVRVPLFPRLPPARDLDAAVKIRCPCRVFPRRPKVRGEGSSINSGSWFERWKINPLSSPSPAISARCSGAINGTSLGKNAFGLGPLLPWNCSRFEKGYRHHADREG